MVRRLAGAAVVAVLVLGTAGCAPAVNHADVEKQVSTTVAARSGRKPASVSCPNDLRGQVGNTLRCLLVTQDGTKYGVGLTTTATDGTDVTYDVEVDPTPTP